MTKSKKNLENQTACSLWTYGVHVFRYTSNPDRKPYFASDLRYAKYVTGKIAAVLATQGPRALDQASTTRVDPICRTDQLPAFASESGSIDDWRDSLVFISKLSSMLIARMCATQEGDVPVPEMFETLGILGEVQTRIVKVLETTGQS